MSFLTENTIVPELSASELDAFHSGDQRIFEVIFRKYHQVIYRYAFALLRCEAESEDVAQTSFIRLYQFRKSIKDASGIYPYLFVITKRLIANVFKTRVESIRIEELDHNDGRLAISSTQQAVHEKELEEILLYYMNKLPKRQREVYRLNKLMGYSYQEISTATGSSKNTVKNQLISASKKIREQIKKSYFLFF